MDAAMVTRIFPALVAVIIFSFCQSADAQIFGGIFQSRAPLVNVVEAPIVWGNSQQKKWRGPPPRYLAPEYYENLNKRYPKFYGGFHSSYFHNMGLPHGDLGARGNGIYPTPW